MSYHAPTDLAEALRIVAAGRSAIVAGGTDFYPGLQQGELTRPILDLTGVGELSGVSSDETEVRIGAATTWSQLIDTPLPPAFDGLKAAAREVGSIQIQNVGTLVGNLCNASPAADGVPPLLTLDASVDLSSEARGARRVPLDRFLVGARQTAMAPDEVVTAIAIPKPPENAVASFEKLGSRRYLVISITMTAVLLVVDASGRIVEARIAVGAASPVAQRLRDLERDLLGRQLEEIEIEPRHLQGLSPIDDVRGTASYRRVALAEQCLRAIRKALRT